MLCGVVLGHLSLGKGEAGEGRGGGLALRLRSGDMHAINILLEIFQPQQQHSCHRRKAWNRVSGATTVALTKKNVGQLSAAMPSVRTSAYEVYTPAWT